MSHAICSFKSKRFLPTLLPYFCIFSLALVLLFTLVSKQEFWTGYDTYFHMNSIYEDAMQIKTGHFSYFISLFGFEQSGRIVNGLYGPIFNYLCGALLLLCGNWIHFEFWIFFITLCICGCSVYWCSRLIEIREPIAVILALFYMISKPVILFWLGNFEFTGLGDAILLPFVLMIAVKMVQQRQIKVVPLSIVMAICLQIHLVTSLIAVLMLVPFAICGYVLSDNRKRMVKHGLFSVLLTICLSGNIFGAIYDVYSTNHLVPTFPNFHLQTTVGNKALKFTGTHITEFGHLYTVLLVIIIILMALKFSSMTTLDWCLLLDDVLFLWMSSTYFPWDQLLKICPVLASIVQFPSRFMAVSFLTTLLLLGRIVSKLTIKLQPIILVGLIFIFVLAFHASHPIISELSQAWQSPNAVQYWVHPSKKGGYSRYFGHGRQIRDSLMSHNLGAGVNVIHKITSDYLPTPHRVDLYRYYHYPINQQYIKIFQHQGRFRKVTRDHALLMRWRNSGTHKIQVPLVKYGRTSVELNHHIIHPKQTLIGTMMVRAKPGMNQLKIEYQPGIMFRLLCLISMLSWLLLLLWLVSRLKTYVR